MEEIKRTFKLKLKPTKKQEEQLNITFNEWGKAVKHTINHIQTIHESHKEQNNPKNTKCSSCKKDILPLKWKHKNGEEICNRCFSIKWSSFTLLNTKGYMKELIEEYPKISPAHKGYYSGIIKFSVQAFKSWIKKCKERDKEIAILEQDIQAEKNPKKQLYLQQKLKQKTKGIKNLEYRSNMVYLGAQSMFEFKKENNNYIIGMASTQVKRQREWYTLSLGKPETYKTEHNKYKLVERCIKTKEQRKLEGKIHRYINNNGETTYEFMFPQRDISTSLSTQEEIKKLFSQKKSIPVITISYGIKKITLLIIQNGKSVKKITIKNMQLWNRICKDRKYRSMTCRIFKSRYTGKWKRKKAIKHFFKKRAKTERKFIQTNTHMITKKIVSIINKEYPNCIIVTQDSKGIKRINYPSIYRKIMYQWNLEMQKTMLEYKNKLRNFHIFSIKYKDSNDVECLDCGKKILKNKKPLKYLTCKLIHGLEQESEFKQKINSLKRKIFFTLKYPSTTENRKWIQEHSTKLTKLNERFAEIKHADKYHTVKCCKTRELYFNEAKQLYKIFSSSHHNGNEGKAEHDTALSG